MLKRIKNFFFKKEKEEDEMELLPKKCLKGGNCNMVIAVLEDPNEIIYINVWGHSKRKICKYLHPKENDGKRLVRINGQNEHSKF